MSRNVARVKARIPTYEPLVGSTWRQRLSSLALTALVVIAGLLLAVVIITGGRL